MIIYGLQNYGYVSSARDERGFALMINRHAGLKQAPPWFASASQIPWDTSLACVRNAERLLGLPKNSIKWSSVRNDAEYNKANATVHGFIDPSSPAAAQREIEKFIRPFSDRTATVLAVNLHFLCNHIDFQHPDKQFHKAYILLMLASCIALGSRMFLMAAQDPDNMPVGYNELKLYRRLFSFSKLNVKLQYTPYKSTQGLKGVGGDSKEIFQGRIECKVGDLTRAFISGYDNLLLEYPNLHMDDVTKVSQAALAFNKSLKLRF